VPTAAPALVATTRRPANKIDESGRRLPAPSVPDGLLSMSALGSVPSSRCVAAAEKPAPGAGEVGYRVWPRRWQSRREQTQPKRTLISKLQLTGDSDAETGHAPQSIRPLPRSAAYADRSVDPDRLNVSSNRSNQNRDVLRSSGPKLVEPCFVLIPYRDERKRTPICTVFRSSLAH